MTTAEAALEAMAAALHARWKDEGCAHVGKWHQCTVDAKAALAALVESEAVREGLVGEVRHPLQKCCVDAVLAALTP